MNILIVSFLARHSPSGVVTHYRTLAQGLAAQGDTVQIVETTDTPFVWNKLLNIIGHVLNRLGRNSRILWHEGSYFMRVYLGARQHRHPEFDLIHAQDIRSGVAAYYALGKKVPVVLTAHYNDDPVTEWTTTDTSGTTRPLSPWLHKLLTRWYTWLFAQVKNYVFSSDYTYRQSKHLMPNDIHRITIYNTVLVTPPNNPGGALPGAATPFIITNVGLVDERKNQSLLIQAGAVLRQHGLTDLQIWLIGDGPKRTEYEQLANDLGMGEHVRFWGRQAEPWRLVAQSDLYVHTAVNDNCPYAIMEAFAVEVPVLALPVGGIPELMPHQHGLLTGRTPDEVADQLLLYYDKDRRAQLRQVQLDYAEQNFRPKDGLKKLISFYQTCIPPGKQQVGWPRGETLAGPQQHSSPQSI